MTDEFAAHRHSAGSISYTDVGQGPVTLFVHGVFTNGRLWRNCVKRLSGHRRCISVDLPGHGHSCVRGAVGLGMGRRRRNGHPRTGSERDSFSGQRHRRRGVPGRHHP